MKYFFRTEISFLYTKDTGKHNRFFIQIFYIMLISKWRVKINLKNYIIIDFLILLGAFQNLGTKILRYNKKYWEFSGVWYKKVIF